MLPIAVLAGGFATRLGSLTESTPKCMLEINGRPFVDWQLDLLTENGYTDFVFCVSIKSDVVIRHLGDGSRKGVNIRYSLDGERQLGTGGAIQKALPLLGDVFGVVYGDSYLPINYSALEQEFMSSNSHGMMAVYQNQGQFDVSNVEYRDGKLIDYEKESKNNNMQHIDYGITLFREAAFSQWVDQSSFDLSKVCHQLAKEGKLDGFEVFERFYEIGSTRGIEQFSEYIRKANL